MGILWLLWNRWSTSMKPQVFLKQFENQRSLQTLHFTDEQVERKEMKGTNQKHTRSGRSEGELWYLGTWNSTLSITRTCPLAARTLIGMSFLVVKCSRVGSREHLSRYPLKSRLQRSEKFWKCRPTSPVADSQSPLVCLRLWEVLQYKKLFIFASSSFSKNIFFFFLQKVFPFSRSTCILLWSPEKIFFWGINLYGMVGVQWVGEKAQASYQQVQDFRCCHPSHFLCLGVSWPASLVGAGMRHKGDRRGESSMGEVDGADFRFPSGVLYFLYLLGEK